MSNKNPHLSMRVCECPCYKKIRMMFEEIKVEPFDELNF